MRIIENKTFDMERALYGSSGIIVKNCAFDGPADGESALKEGRDITADDCFLIYVTHSGMIQISLLKTLL